MLKKAAIEGKKRLRRYNLSQRIDSVQAAANRTSGTEYGRVASASENGDTIRRVSAERVREVPI